MVSLPLSQRRRNFLLHIIVSFTIGIGLMIPQFFAFKTEEVDSHHLYFLTVFFHSISQLYLMCILQLRQIAIIHISQLYVSQSTEVFCHHLYLSIGTVFNLYLATEVDCHNPHFSIVCLSTEVECYHPLTPAYDLTCYDPWVPNLQVAATNFEKREEKNTLLHFSRRSNTFGFPTLQSG